MEMRNRSGDYMAATEIPSGSDDACIVLASGVGSRVSKTFHKQYFEVDGQSVLEMTLMRIAESEAFASVIVVSKNMPSELRARLDKLQLATEIIDGGKTRSISLFLGIMHLAAEESSIGRVAIHDGVRPLASSKLFRQSLSESRTGCVAVPVVEARESIIDVSTGHPVAVPRKNLVVAQTPETIRLSDMLSGYRRVGGECVEGEGTAGVCAKLGFAIRPFAGEAQNTKITYPADLMNLDRIQNRP